MIRRGAADRRKNMVIEPMCGWNAFMGSVNLMEVLHLNFRDNIVKGDCQSQHQFNVQ